MDFDIGEYVFLNVVPIKGVKWFRKKVKLAPKFMVPFQILTRVDKVEYRLELPKKLSFIYSVFHISMHRNHMKADGKNVIPNMTILEVQADTSYKVEPVGILDQSEWQLCNKVTHLLKV